ncbi:hypothetical protein QAD02_022091 [Eretmocerus hayati]|uniref:Uncharacterized protein n=1 Tax=Eretmocerus hayati TaxID=131215 RepID=A0ACC2PSA8_9HYME|nr:hypothetical protein QAD02_022091 [Eretmocerus hayati]
MTRRSLLDLALPPVSPAQLALLLAPPTSSRPSASSLKNRVLPISPAHYRSLLLSSARPRYPVSYVALSRTPRDLSLALKLATAPMEPGPPRPSPRPSSRHLIPVPRSPTLDRGLPASFDKCCPCPLSRRCGNWRPSAPIPKRFSPLTKPSLARLQLPAAPDASRLRRALYPELRTVVSPGLMSALTEHHALRRRTTGRDKLVQAGKW